jgi:septal ring factor EnvC (AmiA/AmiB activator)
MSWPLAGALSTVLIIVVTIVSVTILVAMAIRSRGTAAQDETTIRSAEQFRELAASYDRLLKEMRDTQATLKSELAEIRRKVDSIEHMMREVE